MIPKVVHQVWLGRGLPDSLKHLQTRMLRINPDWSLRMWTEDNLPGLFNEKAYLSLKGLSYKSDVLRYEILARFGGVWCDFDMVWLRPLSEILDLDTADNFFTTEAQGGECPPVNNGIFGVSRNNPIAWKLVAGLRRSFEINAPDGQYNQTGVGYFSRVVRSFPERAVLLPSGTFHPYSGDFSKQPIWTHPTAIGSHVFNSNGREGLIEQWIREGKV